VDPCVCDVQSAPFVSYLDIANDDLASGIALAPEIGATDWRRGFTPSGVRLGLQYDHVLLLRPAGLLVSIAALVVISSLGSDEFKLRDVLLLTVGLAVLVLIVFIYGLGMTVPVLPSFMQE